MRRKTEWPGSCSNTHSIHLREHWDTSLWETRSSGTTATQVMVEHLSWIYTITDAAWCSFAVPFRFCPAFLKTVLKVWNVEVASSLWSALVFLTFPPPQQPTLFRGSMGLWSCTIHFWWSHMPHEISHHLPFPFRKQDQENPLLKLSTKLQYLSLTLYELLLT